MIASIEKNEAEGILARHPDRLARNSIDGGRIIYLVDTGKITTLKFPTFWFDPTPQGKFMLSIAFGQSKILCGIIFRKKIRGVFAKNSPQWNMARLGPAQLCKRQERSLCCSVDKERGKVISSGLLKMYATGEYPARSTPKRLAIP